jgi:hypothetical protein
VPYFVASTNPSSQIGIEIQTDKTHEFASGQDGFVRLVKGAFSQSAGSSLPATQENSGHQQFSTIDWWRAPQLIEKKRKESLFDLKAEMDAEIAWRKKMVLQSLSNDSAQPKDVLYMSREELDKIEQAKREHEKQIQERDAQLKREMDEATKERLRKKLSPIF